MGPDLLPRQETFLCVACPGPAELLPSFLHFKDVGIHSLKDHMVALERAVQASTFLPTTLTTFVCKLCPAGTVSHFLSEDQLKLHMGKHSQFFVQRWKEFSEVQCRICEIVIDQESFEDHMSKVHSRNLFADPDKAKIVVENKEDFSQKLLCSDSETKLKNGEKEVGSDNSSDERSSSQQPKLNNQGLRLKPIDLLLDQSKKQSEASPTCYFGGPQCLGCLKPKVDCFQCRVCLGGKMFLRERCLYVCQCEEDKLWNGKEPVVLQSDESCSKPVNCKLNELKRNQLSLIGIKKHISAQAIKKHFLRNGFQVAEVVTANGSGKVTFGEQEDAQAWKGKVLIIGDCHIRISNKYTKSTECRENKLSIMKVPKTISVDDLYEFFSNEGFDIADINIQPNGCGDILFRNKEDAAYWENIGPNFIVKGIQMPLFGSRKKAEPNIEMVQKLDVSAEKPSKGEFCSKVEGDMTSSSSDQQKESSSKSDLSSEVRRACKRTGEFGKNCSDIKSRRDGHVRDGSRSRFNKRQKSRSRERSRSRSRYRGGTRERSRFGNRGGSRDRGRSRYRSCSSDGSRPKHGKQ